MRCFMLALATFCVATPVGDLPVAQVLQPPREAGVCKRAEAVELNYCPIEWDKVMQAMLPPMS